jgi:phospholipid-binding lipoprotein MlaA
VPGQRDPLEGFNRLSYKISQPIDRYIFRPVALTYKDVVPRPLRDGARNFISNLFEPLVFFNDVVQLRPKRALHTVVRMALNSFVGFGGLFDVAKRPPFHLLHHENGFGDTLGYYGIGPIAYVYLPVLGPTDLRDIVGGVGDSFAEPRLLERLVHPDSDRPLLRAKLKLGRYSAIVEIVQGLDRRAENDDALETIRRTSVDPYATLRSSFLQDRAGEIAGLKAKNGQAPVGPSLEDPLLDPARQ